jgi:ribosome recycling factor
MYLTNEFAGVEAVVVQQWLGIIIAAASVVGIIGGAIRWVVKYYLNEIRHELVPNSGSSMKDQVTRLEKSQEEITESINTNRAHMEDKVLELKDSLESRVDNVERKIDDLHKETILRIDTIYQLIIQKM